MWTDLVRTPTGLVRSADRERDVDGNGGGGDGGEGTMYTLFYAARDTRNASRPFLNCSVTHSSAPCFWGIGKLVVRISLPSAKRASEGT